MKQELKTYKKIQDLKSTKKKSNQVLKGESIKSLFCYISIAILPFVLYSYRFLPKVEVITLFGYEWNFNGFTSSYSFLFAFLSKVAPILFISLFFLRPKPITIFKKKVTVKHFLFPTLLIYCYQVIFIIAPVEKIDEGFYSELVGWSAALMMSSIVIFSNEFFVAISKIFHFFYLRLTLNSYRLKSKIRGLISFILKTRTDDSHSLNQKVYDEKMWEILDKTSK